jgi:hypothetical protein
MSVVYENPPKEKYTARYADAPLVLDVVIGDGQTSSWSVFVDNTPVGGSKPTTIGNGGSLFDKTTTVTATVRDTLHETNWTSITISITESGVTTEFGPYKREVPADKDTCVYTVLIGHE